MMQRWWQNWRRRVAREHGQALPLVLGFMVLGGLVVTPVLNLSTASLESSLGSQQETGGIYAADAGVEYTIWCLQEGVTPPGTLPETINQHSVTMATETIGEYTLYFGEFIEMSEHSDYLTVSGNATWDEPAQAYSYNVTISLTPGAGGTTVFLAEVGVRLPPGYDYVAGSAAGFGDNLDTGEPETGVDSQGSVLLRWQFSPPKPSLQTSDPTGNQVFQITGSGDLDGDYTWVMANREDIGSVSEVSGTVYQVTASATHVGTGRRSARVLADIIDTGGQIYLVSWSLIP